jgi:hypothetical protein
MPGSKVVWIIFLLAPATLGVHAPHWQDVPSTQQSSSAQFVRQGNGRDAAHQCHSMIVCAVGEHDSLKQSFRSETHCSAAADPARPTINNAVEIQIPRLCAHTHQRQSGVN